MAHKAYCTPESKSTRAKIATDYTGATMAVAGHHR